MTSQVREFLRFAVVGVLNVAISFVIFHLCYAEWRLGSRLLTALGTIGAAADGYLVSIGVDSIDAAIATGLGYSAGVINSFLLNSAWTFGVSKGSPLQFVRFMNLSLVGLGLSSLLMFIIVDMGGYPYLLVWFYVTAFVMVINFLGSKYWVFAAVERADDRSSN